MSLKFEDEYAYTLDNLALALKRSYEQIKQTSTFSSEFDYSQAIAKRLRAFYCKMQFKVGWKLLVNGKNFTESKFSNFGLVVASGNQ